MARSALIRWTWRKATHPSRAFTLTTRVRLAVRPTTPPSGASPFNATITRMADYHFDPDWLEGTLDDALNELENVLLSLREDNSQRNIERILSERLMTVYGKLNYAVNTAAYGPEALELFSDDELVAWPNYPFALDALDDVDNVEDEDVNHDKAHESATSA